MQTSSQRPLAVVTGASSGIGHELAKQFVEHDYDVVVVAENAELVAVANALGTLGTEVTPVQVDLARREGVERLVECLRVMGRPIDAIAINAGVGVGGPFIENDLEAELNLIALNVTSVVHLAKRVLPDMVARGKGRVLITSSIAAEAPGPFEAVYAASKAFDLSFAEAIRNEIKDSGVTVTALQPGATETRFFERAGMQDTKVAQAKKSDPADVARQGFEAMMAGKDHVVAAMTKEKIEITVGQILPDKFNASQHRKMAEPGSAEARP